MIVFGSFSEYVQNQMVKLQQISDLNRTGVFFFLETCLVDTVSAGWPMLTRQVQPVEL